MLVMSPILGAGGRARKKKTRPLSAPISWLSGVSAIRPAGRTTAHLRAFDMEKPPEKTVSTTIWAKGEKVLGNHGNHGNGNATLATNRASAEANKRMARRLVADVRQDAEEDHAGIKGNWASKARVLQNALDPVKLIKGKAGTNQQRKQLILQAATTGVGLLAGVGIAAATGGASIPVMIAIGAGLFVIKQTTGLTLTQLFGQSRTKNWKAHYAEVDVGTRGAHSRALTEDATYAIRRVVDHYLKVWDAARELNVLLNRLQQGTMVIRSREDAVLAAQFLFRLHYKLFKVRNYLLPCFDTVIFMLNHYCTAGAKWNAFYNNFESNLSETLARVDHSDCAHCKCCYGPRSDGSGPVKARPVKSSPAAGEDVTVGKARFCAEVSQIVDALQKMDLALDKANSSPLDTKSLWQIADQYASHYAKRRANARAGATAPTTKDVYNAAFACLQQAEEDVVIKRGLGDAMFASLANWYSRTTAGEKAAVVTKGALGLALGMASPVVGDVLTTTLPAAVMHGVEIAGHTFFHVGLGDAINKASKGPQSLLQTLTGVAIDKGLPKLDSASDALELDRDPDHCKKLGQKVESTFKKIASHGTEAHDLLKELAGRETYLPDRCEEIYEIVKAVETVPHHLDKMLRYSLEVVDFLLQMYQDCQLLAAFEKKAIILLQQEIVNWAASGGD
jgi:hypothetical protein